MQIATASYAGANMAVQIVVDHALTHKDLEKACKERLDKKWTLLAVCCDPDDGGFIAVWRK